MTGSVHALGLFDAPSIPTDAIEAAARLEGVCARPILTRLTDTETGKSRLVPIPCGSTREAQCPACADRARRLRMQQCREGWHLDHEPDHGADDDQDDGDQDDGDQVAGHEDAGEGAGRRVRSTRRRQDAPDLPRHKVEAHTVGRVFTAPDGTSYRPSMFLTLTLGSYGRVRSDGTPVDPGTYDYRRAALDALHFPKLVDRFWQNLRRGVGYNVQYFACVEAQRRLAPHLHAAIRGAIPRQVLRQVIAATYHQVWWPAHDEPVYVDTLPQWDELAGGYVDPATGELLPTWEEALDALDCDPEARPAHMLWFGQQCDIQGLLAGTADADRRIGYLCKYLTKSIADTYDDPEHLSVARRRHLARLHEEVRWLPCSPRCCNWLRFGVQPKDARDGMVPGSCPGKAHRYDALGCGGRRVLVSRRWTGKTLTDHRADRAAVVRAVLDAAGIAALDVDRYSAAALAADGKPRYVWAPVRLDAVDQPARRALLILALKERQEWRTQYEQAKERAGPELLAHLSATDRAPAEEVVA